MGYGYLVPRYVDCNFIHSNFDLHSVPSKSSFNLQIGNRPALRVKNDRQVIKLVLKIKSFKKCFIELVLGNLKNVKV